MSISMDSTGVGESLWFETATAVRQGSILSTLLFIMYLNLAIKEILEHQLVTNVLAYANYLAQLDQSEEDLQNHLTSWF